MIDETVFRKMVSDSRIVTPENKNSASKKIHGGIAIQYLHRTEMFLARVVIISTELSAAAKPD